MSNDFGNWSNEPPDITPEISSRHVATESYGEIYRRNARRRSWVKRRKTVLVTLFLIVVGILVWAIVGS